MHPLGRRRAGDGVRKQALDRLLDAFGYHADHLAEIERYIEQGQVPDDVVHASTRPDA